MLFAAGFFAGVVDSMVYRSGALKCPKCGEPFVSTGRHFDPLGSKRPHRCDLALLASFVALNVVVCLAI